MATERIDPPLVDVYVPAGVRSAKDTNKAEADAIVAEIEAILRDPKLRGRSLGIVSLLGPDQAQYIDTLVPSRCDTAELMRRNFACGDARVFQGSERDIMFLSMVADSKSHHALSGNMFEQISHDCALGEDAFQHLQRPRQIDGQRASAPRFGDANTQAVLNAVLMFVFIARGFTNKNLRQQFAVLLGKRAEGISPGRMSYELRRPRLHGLIERLPKSHRYRLTDEALRTALFYTRVHSRILRPAMAPVAPAAPTDSPKALRQFQAAEAAVKSWCDEAHITA